MSHAAAGCGANFSPESRILVLMTPTEGAAACLRVRVRVRRHPRRRGHSADTVTASSRTQGGTVVTRATGTLPVATTELAGNFKFRRVKCKFNLKLLGTGFRRHRGVHSGRPRAYHPSHDHGGMIAVAVAALAGQPASVAGCH